VNIDTGSNPCLMLQALGGVVEGLQAKVACADIYRKDSQALLENYK